MNKKLSNKLAQDEKGMVAIIVTMIIMIILSLIVLGFAQLTRREQRQSLDRQLSTQAYYAAETGINDATDAIRRNLIPLNQDYTSDCGAFKTAAGLDIKSQLRGPDVTYSCLLVDPSPTSLEYQDIEMNSSEVFPIQEKNNAAITDITVAWEGSAMSGSPVVSGCPALNSFPATWSNCDTGILKVEFVPFAGATSRAQLTDNRNIAYLQPLYSGGVSTFAFNTASSPTGQGAVVGVSCNVSANSKDCNIRLTGLNTTKGFMRVFAIYRGADVTICSPTCNTPLELAGAQAQIDVTGRAVDVLRRVQVRAPTAGRTDYPEFAAQSFNTLCKRLAIAPPTTVTISGYPVTSVCGPNATN